MQYRHLCVWFWCHVTCNVPCRPVAYNMYFEWTACYLKASLNNELCNLADASYHDKYVFFLHIFIMYPH